MKFLVTADLHLGAGLAAWGSQSAAARAEQERAWDEAIALVEDDAVDGLIVAGDLFDAPEPPAPTLEMVRRGLGRISDRDKCAVILPGIYDGLASPRNVYQTSTWPAAVTVVDWARPRVVPIGRGDERLLLHTFAPLPGSERPAFEPRPDEAPAGPEYRVGLFHAVPDPGSPLASWATRIEPDALVELGLDLLIVGGDHRRREALWGRTRVVTPGSPVPLRPGEAGESAWTFVTLSPGGIEVEIRRREVPLDPAREAPPPVSADPRTSAERSPGGLRAALLRVYEERLQGGEDRALLEAALRYSLERLDRPEVLRVD